MDFDECEEDPTVVNPQGSHFQRNRQEWRREDLLGRFLPMAVAMERYA